MLKCQNVYKTKESYKNYGAVTTVLTDIRKNTDHLSTEIFDVLISR